MSVLTHVVLKKSLPSEPVATQSLAYILNAEQNIARAFIGIFRETGIAFEPADIQAEIRHEDSCPDLTIRDDHGHVRVFVENKFWAGLTEAQPVSYLRCLGNLSENFPTALLFIVPQQRVNTVWNELERRCHNAKLEWENGLGTPNIRWSHVNHEILLITNWTHVLESLLDAAPSGEQDSIRHDILQLQDLTNQMDLEAFLPIRADELTDQETARRLINYCDLIKSITQELQNSKLADNVRDSHSWYYHGNYLRVHERFELWFGIQFEVWCKFGGTPLWWIFNDNDYAGVNGHLQTILNRNLFKKAYYDEQTGNLCIPISLMASVERDAVVKNAAEQMTDIAKTLLVNFPDNH